MASRSRKAQWVNAGVYAALAVVQLGLNPGGVATVIAVVLLGVAAAASPLFKRKSVSRDEALASGNDVVIYHRPGCTFCIRMKAMLGLAGTKATWVDIWDDQAAAKFVRSVNDGNETVPTVVIDGTAHTNPAPSLVRDALAA